jgi:predicted dithiol-disulfide oxidoreductase (DUF899 family)
VQPHSIVSRDQWLIARRQLLAEEKELTRQRDRVNAARLALPWVRLEQEYSFDTPTGRKTLAELFGARSQLIIYHFMMGPEWEAGCPGCSFLADHLDGAMPHLVNHDVSLVVVSRAPLARIEAYRKRMGWRFPWVSSLGSSFNFDFQVSFTPEQLEKGPIVYNFEEIGRERANDELPGLSAFYKDEAGAVFHTDSAYARGLEDMVSALMILDKAPKGRNETSTLSFVRRHDEYAERVD